jgi:hypothetical protein
MLRFRPAQMWTDRQLMHRIELLAQDALEHEADVQGDVRNACVIQSSATPLMVLVGNHVFCSAERQFV